MSSDPLRLIAKHVDIAKIEKFTEQIKKYKQPSSSSTSASPPQQHAHPMSTDYSYPSWSPNLPATVPVVYGVPITTSTQQETYPTSNVYSPSSYPTVPERPSHEYFAASDPLPVPVPTTNPTSAHITSHCIAGARTSLFLKEKKFSLTGDDSSIKDSSGNTVFKVHSNLLTLSQRRHIFDSHGRDIGNLRKKKSPTLHPTVYIGTEDDDKKFKVKVTGILNPFKCDAKISARGSKEVGRVSGNWRAKKFSIVIGGTLAATVSRKTTAASLFVGADSYCIDVRAGMDMAFVSLVVIALDELYHDEE